MVWQKNLHDTLMRQDSMGGLRHGTTIEVYQSPNGDKMIEMIDATHFNCLCCPTPAINNNAGAHNAGLNFSNVMMHMCSKAHWTNFRRNVFDQPFDEAAWLAFTAGSQHGPARAKRTAQYQSRAASSDLKREAVQRAKRQAHLRRLWRLVARVAALNSCRGTRAPSNAPTPPVVSGSRRRAPTLRAMLTQRSMLRMERRLRRLASRSACRRAQHL